uniref:Nuclear pore complex protein NUP1 isoform X2 n=1 Tax=Elaeis guineensis var. tenera TaxID=51953 RepID=A0A6I9S3Y0_ELAGV|nr:nuclear pore complex protein NUP1 isoform X2 [Elaeis guineensis]
MIESKARLFNPPAELSRVRFRSSSAPAIFLSPLISLPLSIPPMAAAAAAACEGGGGGKFRKRFSRRAPVTPYDRSPAAARGLLWERHPPVEPGGSGWLHKLVDPASWIIARRASRLLPSIFRKRLADPPAAPEENHQSRQEVPENSSSEAQEQCGLGGENPKDNHDAGGAQLEINPDGGGISELEQLLNQKTFTSVEFERLTELLHSQTIEPSTSQPAVNRENEEKANVSDQGIHNKVSTAEPSTSQPADNHDQKEKTNVPEQEAIAFFRVYGSVRTPVSLVIPKETASPAEIAKAYMGSRSSKVSPSTLSLRSQIFQGDAAPYAKKSFDMAIAPRSVVCFSGIPELMDNGYTTPRPHGRSAIYRMSRSPYFKAHPMTKIRGGRPVDDYSGPSTSSQWTSANILSTGSKLALKRGSSVLDSDGGSLGLIRRIRQKSNLMSPSRNIHSSLPGNLLPAPSSPLRKGANQGSTALSREPLHLDEPKYSAAELQDAENGYNRIPSASVVPILPQSSETARKILQQLDKLVPSPKEKSELKIIDWDEMPSKLTQTMLHEWDLKSMEDIDSSKFLKVQVSDNLDVPSSSHLKSLRSSTSQKQERAGENGPLKPAVTGTQVTSEAVGAKKSVIYAMDAKPGMRSADFAFLVTASVPSQKKPSFHMSAPEDSLDLDDHNYYFKDTSGLASTGDDKCELISECKKDHPGNLEKSPGSASKSMPSSSLILDKRSEAKASDRPVSEKNDAFLFPSASLFKTSSQTPSPPMSTTLLERSTPQKEGVAGPTFKFVFKESQSSTISSIITAVSNPASLNFGVSNGATSTLPDGSNSDKEGNQNAGDVFQSFGNTISSQLSSSTRPALFAFGESATPTLSNGSLSLASISAAPAMTFSDSPVTSVFSTSIVTSTSSGSPSISSVTTVCSMVPSFQLGSGASTGASTLVTPCPNQSDSKGLEGKSIKASSFGISSSITLDSAVAFSSTGSNNSASATSSVFSSMGTSSSSSVLQESRLFSSTTSGSLALSTSLVSMDNGFFPTMAAAHSSSEKLSYANNSYQTSASAFGATGGSNFNTQATQSGSGVSNFSQSSPSQSDSFTSQPGFGLTGSSSSSSASSLFGSATPATKSLGTSSIFSFSTSVSSSSSSSGVFFASTASFGTSSGFSFSSGTISSSSSGGSTSFAPVTPFGSASGFPFSTGAGSSSGSGSSSSFASTAANIFNSSSQPSTSSIFGSTFGSTTPLLSSGFSFGLSARSSASSPFRFDTSSRPAFSFTSAGTATATSPSPSGVQNPAVSFSSGSPGNDRMNVEDSMTDDTNQASAPVVPTFGQQTNLTATPSFMFCSLAGPSGEPSVFQIGSQQNNSILQNPSPFQAAGNVEFAAGRSFSLGSGGGDKSGRKLVRVRRDKHRKK